MSDLLLFLGTAIIVISSISIFVIALISAINNAIILKRIKSAIRKLSKEISDKKVQSFIKILERSKIQNHPYVYNRLRAAFTLVNNSDEVSYSIKQELMNTLLSKGVHLGNLRIQKSQKERELEKRETGKKGEETVSHNLDFLKLSGYKVLHNVRIPSAIQSQEIDHIVIGTNGVFHIETKNHYGSGKIIIDRDGNWIKDADGKMTSIENPIAQVDRHDIVLKDYLNKRFPGAEIPVHPIIVLATSNYVLEGQENSEVPVVKVDQLTTFIKKINSNITLDEKIINEINRELQRQK